MALFLKVKFRFLLFIVFEKCLFVPDNPRQTTRVPVFIKVLDVNDNAPEFAMSYDTFVCENVKAGQVLKIHEFIRETLKERCVWVTSNVAEQ